MPRKNTAAVDSASPRLKRQWRQWQNDTRRRVDRRLQQLLPRGGGKLGAAMRYAALQGGKRVRPLVAVAAAQDAKEKENLDAACALEMLHCYSLIHDDLPCMDDDDLRRGRPSCHIKFGEARALLAGDCLQAAAFETLARAAASAVPALARAAGLRGMGGGQELDLASGGGAKKELIEKIHKGKTGALFCCAVQMGVGGGKNITAVQKKYLQDFACAFGDFFQLANDLKDRECDVAKNRPNLAVCLGEEKTRARLRSLRRRAFAQLQKANLAHGRLWGVLALLPPVHA